MILAKRVYFPSFNNSFTRYRSFLSKWNGSHSTGMDGFIFRKT